MKYIILLITVSLLVSCSGQKYYCTPSKKSRDYAEVILKEGSISKDHVKTMLVSNSRTQLGYRHIFLTDNGDSIIKYFNYRFEKNKCYWVHKNYLKISS